MNPSAIPIVNVDAAQFVEPLLGSVFADTSMGTSGGMVSVERTRNNGSARAVHHIGRDLRLIDQAAVADAPRNINVSCSCGAARDAQHMSVRGRMQDAVSTAN